MANMPGSITAERGYAVKKVWDISSAPKVTAKMINGDLGDKCTVQLSISKTNNTADFKKASSIELTYSSVLTGVLTCKDISWTSEYKYAQLRVYAYAENHDLRTTVYFS